MCMNKAILILIVAFAAINPIQYAVLKYSAPPGLVFNAYGSDDALLLTSIKYHEFNFQSPWILKNEGIDGNVFLNPANGPVYLMAALGIFHALTNLDPLLIFITFKFLSAILMLLMVYYLILQLVKNEKKADVIFLVFALSAGFGGIMLLILSPLTGHSIFYPFTLFGFGIGAFRIVEVYQSFAFALAVISIILSLKRRHFFSGIFLGIATLTYPPYGLAALIAVFLYSCVVDKFDIRNFLIVVLISALFASPWVMAYFQQPYFFRLASEVGVGNSAHILLSVLIGFGMLLCFLLYQLSKNLKKINLTVKNYKIYIASWIAALILLTINELSYSQWAKKGPIGDLFNNLGIGVLLDAVRPYSIFFYAPILLLSVLTGMDVLRRKKKIGKYNSFLILWFLAILIVVAFPVSLESRFPPKIVGFLALPVALIAGEGAINYASRRRISALKIISIIFIVSLPSFALYYAFEQSLARDIYNPDGTVTPQTFYYHYSDRAAMSYLKDLEPGVVLSSPEIGAFIPYYSGKQALLEPYDKYIVVDYAEKSKDVAAFFSATTSLEGRTEILKKYGIKYIIYGPFEIYKYGKGFDAAGLTEVYREGDTALYSVP